MIKDRHRTIWVRIALLVVLLVAMGYSFYQHHHMPIGGDVAQIVLPTTSSGYYEVLQDPFALRVLKHKIYYPNPNRFFVHKSAALYFLCVPTFLQKWVSPIESIYLSIALFKTAVQFLIIYVLCYVITWHRSPLAYDFMMVALLLIPLFQAAGFNRFMGVIDQSAIYTFFYALPLGLLLSCTCLFLVRSRMDLNNFQFTGLICMGPVLALGGPLVPAVILVGCLVTFVGVLSAWFRGGMTLNALSLRLGLTRKRSLVIGWWLVLSLYSLYIGTYNQLNFTDQIPVWDRYLRLPTGLWELVTTKIGLPLLLSMLVLNLFIINFWFRNEAGVRVMKIARWIGIFTVLYLLLLPLGGYRIYRPNIIRYDTFMPITIAIIYLYGRSTFYLICHLSRSRRSIYLVTIILFLSVFIFADVLHCEEYFCERRALETIANSTEDVVRVSSDCPVMEFRLVGDPQHSHLKASLLQHWNVVSDKRLFYQVEN